MDSRRELVGRVVRCATAERTTVGVLLSVTTRSLWLIVDDTDVVIPTDQVLDLARSVT